MIYSWFGCDFDWWFFMGSNCGYIFSDVFLKGSFSRLWYGSGTVPYQNRKQSVFFSHFWLKNRLWGPGWYFFCDFGQFVRSLKRHQSGSSHPFKTHIYKSFSKTHWNCKRKTHICQNRHPKEFDTSKISNSEDFHLRFAAICITSWANFHHQGSKCYAEKQKKEAS